jgi:hypothetical protein
MGRHSIALQIEMTIYIAHLSSTNLNFRKAKLINVILTFFNSKKAEINL